LLQCIVYVLYIDAYYVDTAILCYNALYTGGSCTVKF
jgi:hypothetical protein